MFKPGPQQEVRNVADKELEDMKLSEEQKKILEHSFCRESRYPDGCSLMLVSAECGLTEEDTLKWFRLRNVKWRQQEGLPANIGSVLD